MMIDAREGNPPGLKNMQSTRHNTKQDLLGRGDLASGKANTLSSYPLRL
jgi:hypothetical protein